MSNIEVHKPTDIVMVRHGETGANVVNGRRKKGEQLVVPELANQHESLWRLSALGVEQAKIAGGYVLNTVILEAGVDFRFIVSPHNRTMETATEMDISPEWEPRLEVREREWAGAAYLSPEERRQKFEDNEKIREMSYYYWTPPYGESIAQMVDLRVRSMMSTLYREEASRGVIMVTHGEYMWGVRSLLEKLHPLEFNAQDKDRAYNIPNTMVMQYSRRNPETGEMGEHFEWRRAVCPWDNDRSWVEGAWVKIPAGRRKVGVDQLKEWYQATPAIEIPN